MSGGLDYVPGLIAAYQAGHASDHMHLGYWPQPALGWRAAQAAMADLHLDLLMPQDGDAITDMGCGLGNCLRLLNDRLRNSHLTGVNIDARQLAVCREITALKDNTLQWLAADACSTGLPKGSQDGVLSLEAMFHFPSRHAFLSECHRLLRAGGRLVCSDIIFDAPQSKDESAWLDMVTDGYAPWPDPVIDVPTRDTLTAGAGFTDVTTMDISLQVLPTWDFIVSSTESPLSNPQAAMKALHHAGRLRYVVTTATRAG